MKEEIKGFEENLKWGFFFFCKLMRSHKQPCYISQCDVRYLTEDNQFCLLLWIMESLWLHVSPSHSFASLAFICKWGIVSCCYGFWKRRFVNRYSGHRWRKRRFLFFFKHQLFWTFWPTVCRAALCVPLVRFSRLLQMLHTVGYEEPAERSSLEERRRVIVWT